MLRLSQEQMLRGKRHDGVEIRIFSVLYDGVLMVAEFRIIFGQRSWEMQ